MDTTDNDTEVLLALLSSLLHPLEFDQQVLLDALVRSQGDVEKAAGSLRSEPPRKKRRISSKSGLEGWLKAQDAPSKTTTASTSKPPSPRPTVSKSARESTKSAPHDVPSREGLGSVFSDSPKKPSSKVKSVTNTELMALLRPPNSAGETSKTQLPRYPPLTLITPEHVAEHTPCTLHNSILPPELACR